MYRLHPDNVISITDVKSIWNQNFLFRSAPAINVGSRLPGGGNARSKHEAGGRKFAPRFGQYREMAAFAQLAVIWTKLPRPNWPGKPAGGNPQAAPV